MAYFVVRSSNPISSIYIDFAIILMNVNKTYCFEEKAANYIQVRLKIRKGLENIPFYS